MDNPVKRTFLFGMLGAMAALFFVVDGLFGIYSYNPDGYRYLNNFKEDALFYAFTERIFTNSYYPIVCAAISLLFISLIAWLLYKKSFIKKEHLSVRSTLLNYLNTHAGGYAWLAGRTIICVVLVCSAYLIATYYYDYWINDFSIHVVSSYSRAYWVLAYFILVYIPLIPLCFALVSLLYAVIAPRNIPELKTIIKVPLAGIIVFGAMLFSMQMARSPLDLDKKLSDIPGVIQKASPRSVYVLSGNCEIGRLDDYYEYTPPSMQREKMFYGEDNEEAIVKYLEEMDYSSGLSWYATEFIRGNSFRMLNPRYATKAVYEEFSHTGDAYQSMSLNLGLSLISAIEENRWILDEYSNEEVFSPMGYAALKIGYAYSKFGEMDKAWYWYEKAVSSGTKLLDDDEFERNKPPTKPLFYGGNISGRLSINSIKEEGVRIGIMKRTSADGLVKQLRMKQKIDPYIYLVPVLDGTATDSEGRFSFTGLGEEEYVLLLSLEDVPGKKYRVVNSPGPITVSEDNPSVEVGTIELVLVDEDNG